mgnify:CR=1 FL=1
MRVLTNNFLGYFCSLESTWLWYLLEFLGLMLLLNSLGNPGFIFFWVLIICLEMMATKALWSSFQCGSPVVFLVTNTGFGVKELRLLLATPCCHLGTRWCFRILWHAITTTITYTQARGKIRLQTRFEKTSRWHFGSSFERWTRWESLIYPYINELSLGNLFVIDWAERCSSYCLTAIGIVYSCICMIIYLFFLLVFHSYLF